MFKILDKTLRTGTVTTSYPESAAKLSANFRGMPEFDLEKWRDARPAAEACPAGAIRIEGRSDQVPYRSGKVRPIIGFPGEWHSPWA